MRAPAWAHANTNTISKSFSSSKSESWSDRAMPIFTPLNVSSQNKHTSHLAISFIFFLGNLSLALTVQRKRDLFSRTILKWNSLDLSICTMKFFSCNEFVVSSMSLILISTGLVFPVSPSAPLIYEFPLCTWLSISIHGKFRHPWI